MVSVLKSPLNYTGGKCKLLPCILPVFAEAQGVTRFIDLFCGGLNVGINISYPTIVANDTLRQIMELYQTWRVQPIDDVLAAIKLRIQHYGLTKQNKAGFLALRAAYNFSAFKDPIDFFVLVCYGFNNQIRFNRRGEFNLPFGLNRSSFNASIRANLIAFCEALKAKQIILSTLDFEEALEVHLGPIPAETLIYCDPPYLISTATYNESGGWTETEERRLYAVLDRAHHGGARFVLSNLMSHGDKENTLLREWATRYRVRTLDYTYSHCSYHKKDSLKRGEEVLVTNY